MEEALGMSYSGKRTLVTMKHVGLNVAADPFVNSGITGTNGGLVVAVADDPSMHSSQNEQDSRHYGKFALVPVFEPSNQQEAYNMPFDAFALSENIKYLLLLDLLHACRTPVQVFFAQISLKRMRSSFLKIRINLYCSLLLHEKL